MDGLRKKAIRDKAAKINKEAEQYQLIHATYAARFMIKGMVMDYYKEKCDELSQRIEDRFNRGLDIENEMNEKRDLLSKAKQSSFHIDVEYIDTKTEDMARVVKVENSFIINLPKSLALRVFKADGEYDYKVIQKIRRLMAHELGHLILHTNELLLIESTQGSIDISLQDQEEEARYFANELIELRRERNERFYKDRVYKNF